MRVDVRCPKHAQDGALGQSQPGRSHWDVAPARDDGVTLSRGAFPLARPDRRHHDDAIAATASSSSLFETLSHGPPFGLV